jgi:two-component system sensor histidine kinase VanS
MAEREPGLSARWKLTLSYAAFVMAGGVLVIAVVWVFLLRDQPLSRIVPNLSDFRLVLDPHNFGPSAFGAAAVMGLGFLLVFALVGGWFLAGRMLAPLDRIADAARAAAGGSLAHRIRLEGRSDEFRELADTFDAMLARLEAHVDEQQRFAANASHELRTPLAVTQTLLDVARRDPDRDNGELVERLHAVNTRAIDLTEALLLLSRADQRSFVPEELDLSLVAEEAAESLLPLAEERGVALEVSGEAAPAQGSHALLLQLATNLVHNAIVHNLDEGGRVWVRTAPGVLVVENTGAKLGAQLVATLTEPFQRGSQRVRSHHTGVGLGLAIADSITRAHGGTLELEPREDGGLRATVRLA